MSEAVQLQSAGAEQNRQFLAFRVGSEEYAVDILRVQEIRGWEAGTQLPNAPPHVKGIINLRGTIIPIIDLRERFGVMDIEYVPTTVVIVLKVVGAEKERIMGVVVDAVNDVHHLLDTQIEPPPELDSMAHTDFISGVASVQDRMVILLDIDRLLNL
ncbi:MAG TPA: chemotaxis protein CheW [Myxococcales bacterium LLY-WYZ-16_1]|jgi:purine-binding chemotaxis protein CheW|nr:chemotaxis protein CheW [Myxococcales bacterium LLY-WYZ-16_1]